MKVIEKMLFIAAAITGVLTLMIFLTAMVWATWSWAGQTFWPKGPAFLVVPSPGLVFLGLLAAWFVRVMVARRQESRRLGESATKVICD